MTAIGAQTDGAVQAPKPAALHIPTLDGLRAASFALVFLAHAGLGDRVPGGFGVTVFFFLSGYLIATLLRLEIERTGKIDFRAFYLRRVLRILPPFYLILFAAVTLSEFGLLPGRAELAPTLAQVFHFANYWQILHTSAGQASGTGVYWSLAVEEHFYLIFPWLYLLLWRFVTSSKRPYVILAVCATVLAWRCYLVHVGVSTERTYAATDTRFDSLLFGCLLATTNNPALERPGVPASNFWKWGLLPLGIAALLFSFLYRGSAFRETFRYTLQGLALIPIFVVGIRNPGWGPFALLNLRGAKFVGLLSYSLYLIHQVVLAYCEKNLHLSAVTRGGVAIVISFALALVVHRYVERPTARLRRRWGASREKQPLASAAGRARSDAA